MNQTQLPGLKFELCQVDQAQGALLPRGPCFQTVDRLSGRATQPPFRCPGPG